MNIQVTSVSKREQKLSRTAAAIFVITQEDIQRSGATNIPDLLRMVPGLDVAQINANNWAVSARGFNSRVASGLLVLIDGRSLYSPDFAGVFWQIQQLMLEDIERIEVIRGPGATLWGANAVCGVVNIITKKAQDTQGGLVSTRVGVQERGSVSVRYGASDRDRVNYRVYASYFNRGGFQNALGQEARDDWYGTFGGFRSDWRLSRRDSLTIEGDAYNDSTHMQTNLPVFAPPFTAMPLTTTTFHGGDVNSRWTRTYSPKSEISLRMYYDGFSRDDILIDAFINTFNVDFEQRLALGSRHDLVWGAGYRFTDDSTAVGQAISLNPRAFQTHLPWVFVQDEVALIRGHVWFTPGINFENAPFTGYNVQPSGRILWSISPSHSLWTSAALVDRTAQRFERSLHDITAVFPALDGSLASVDLFGSPSAGDQDTLDFQIGYRAQITNTFTTDLATFYDHYSDLQTTEPGASFFSSTPVPHTVFPLYYANGMHGKGYGSEISISWKPVQPWKLSTGYSFLRLFFQLNPGSQSPNSLLTAGDNPQHQFQIRSQLNLPHQAEFDTYIYHTGQLADQFVPANTRLDVRLGWHPREMVDISLTGQNLLDQRHLEFLNNTGIVSTYNPRRVFAEVIWRITR